jgi:hypothetical protein
MVPELPCKVRIKRNGPLMPSLPQRRSRIRRELNLRLMGNYIFGEGLDGLVLDIQAQQYERVQGLGPVRGHPRVAKVM